MCFCNSFMEVSTLYCTIDYRGLKWWFLHSVILYCCGPGFLFLVCFTIHHVDHGCPSCFAFNAVRTEQHGHGRGVYWEASGVSLRAVSSKKVPDRAF